MRTIGVTTIGLILLTGPVVLAADAPRSAEDRIKAEAEFESLRKHSSIVYSDRANHRLPARIKHGEWRKAGRRLGLRIEPGGSLELRLRRSRVQTGEKMALLVRWTELVPAARLTDDERAFYRGKKRSKGMHHVVPRAQLLVADWDPAERDARTGDCVCVVTCGKLPFEIEGRKLKVQVVSYVAKPDARAPDGPGRDSIRPPIRPGSSPRRPVR